MHVVRGIAVLANGGVLVRPTILAQDNPGNTGMPGAPASGVIEASATTVTPAAATPALLNPSTADIIKRLMRIVVTVGYGK